MEIKTDSIQKQIAATRNDSTDQKDMNLKQACSEFESLFINEILKTARKSFPKNDFLGNSHGSDVYKSMMDMEVAKCLSKGNGMGVGELLYEQLSKQNDSL